MGQGITEAYQSESKNDMDVLSKRRAEQARIRKLMKQKRRSSFSGEPNAFAASSYEQEQLGGGRFRKNK